MEQIQPEKYRLNVLVIHSLSMSQIYFCVIYVNDDKFIIECTVLATYTNKAESKDDLSI